MIIHIVKTMKHQIWNPQTLAVVRYQDGQKEVMGVVAIVIIPTKIAKNQDFAAVVLTLVGVIIIWTIRHPKRQKRLLFQNRLPYTELLRLESFALLQLAIVKTGNFCLF